MSAVPHQRGARPHALSSAPRRRPGLLTRLGRIGAPLVFAGAAAALWAAAETFLVVEPAAVPLDCLGIGVAAWALPTLILVVLALLVRALFRRLPFMRALLFPDRDRLPVGLSAVVLAIAGVFLLDWALNMLGGNAITQRLGTAIGVFGYVLAAALVFRPVVAATRWVTDRLPGFTRGRGVFLTLVISSAVVGLLVGRALHPEYFREVGWQIPASLATVFGAALLGTVAPRALTYLMAVVAGLAVGVVAYHHTHEPSQLAVNAMGRRGVVTPFLQEAMKPPRFGNSLAGPETVQACRPGDALTPVGSIGTVAPDAPDIILLTIDGWRWDYSSLAEDSEHDVTPRIESHAARAAVFERAYTSAPSTRQSFRSIFSGVIPGRVSAPATPETRWALSFVEGQPTLAGYLGAAGYETIALVSDQGAFPRNKHGLDGFAEIDERFVDFRNRRGYVASYAISHIISRLARPPEPNQPPRFLWTHLNEPHFPFSYGPELPTGRRLPYKARHLHSLRYVDQQVNRLLQFISGRERKDNTWVFITSDHGEQFNEHGRRRHGSSVYEEEIHIPLLIWGPGVEPGRRETPLSLIDLFPTIIDAAGLEIPQGVCGESFKPALVDGGEPDARPVYAAALPDKTVEWFFMTWIDGDRKLIVDGSTGAREVYDLEEDAGEEHNLAEDDPEAGEDMLEGLRGYFQAHGLNPVDYSLGP